jgi:hypothetical protein
MQEYFISDTKNAGLAWASTLTSFFTALEVRDVITIVSAIVLPVIFFTVGKTVDVLIQVYIRRREASKSEQDGGE